MANSNNIKISVIIPIYNVEGYLEECLNSVISQTLKEIEIICVNDGSTDNSLNIIQKYANEDSRIVIVDQKNQGVSRARNNAIRIATGEFVCFIDPDDFYPTNDVLEALYNGAVQNNVKVCGGEFQEFNEKNKTINKIFSNFYYGYLFNESKLVKYSDYQFAYGFHRFIYERLFILENNLEFPPYVLYEDPVFLVKALSTAGVFYGLHKTTYTHRISHKPSYQLSEKSAHDFLQAILDILNFSLMNNYTKLTQDTAIRFERDFPKYKPVLNSDLLNLIKQIAKVYPHLLIYVHFSDYILSQQKNETKIQNDLDGVKKELIELSAKVNDQYITISYALNYKKIIMKYWRYKLLAKLTFGKKKKHYNDKRKIYKEKIKRVKKSFY